MLQDAEDVPEVPPSPRRFFVNLYALSDLEPVILRTYEYSLFGENFLLDARETLERPPIPEQMSIHLFPLSDVSRSENTQNDAALQLPEEPHYYTEDMEEQAPLPRETAFNLYPLQDLELQPSQGNRSKAETEVPPFPQKHLIELHSVSDSLDSLGNSQFAHHHSGGTREDTPSPAQISVDLYPMPTLEPGVPAHAAHMASREDQGARTQDVHPLSRSVELFLAEGTTMAEESSPPLSTTSLSTDPGPDLRYKDPEQGGHISLLEDAETTAQGSNFAQERKKEEIDASEAHEAAATSSRKAGNLVVEDIGNDDQSRGLEQQAPTDQETLIQNLQGPPSSMQGERQKPNTKALALINTSKSLILDDDPTQSINQRLGQMQNDLLDAQLDYHRELEKHLVPPIPGSERIPPKSRLKAKSDKVAMLEGVITRYGVRGDQNQALHQALVLSLGLESESSSSILQSGSPARLGGLNLKFDDNVK